MSTIKRAFILVLALSLLLLLSVTASAQHDWQNDRHYDNDSNWQHTHHHDYQPESQLPFRWHDRYASMREHHRLERIYDRDWGHRFPGLRAYRWHGQGFWHHGHFVDDAVLFFDEDNELVSVGYLSDGAFIYLRDDHEVYENRDSFFLSWWSGNTRIVIGR
ncbi:MAG: hypothetical protein P4N41_12120 [Negativicutes bacterium]|nr:hypothetical protein [Negativicutes bacterium]